MEIYVLVERRKTLSFQFLGAFVLACTIMSFIGSLFIYLLIIPAVVLGCVWFFIFLHHSKEYEYSYFDGELRFARVMNKSRRKSLYHFSMDDVVQIAPVGDRSLHNYENDRKITHKDMTSGRKGVPQYEIVVRQDNKEPIMIKLEPDKRYLDAIAVRYRQKLIRLPEQDAEIEG